MAVHPHAGTFDEAAADYELGRPGYPEELLGWIGQWGHLQTGCTVVDLGAGTGKLTRVLVKSDANIIAIEPLEGMRQEFARLLPDTELLDATAEAIPLPDSSVHMVTCGQSFRWFATDEALEEIARVLCPGGELVLAFNSYDDSKPIQRRLTEIQRVAADETIEDKPGASWREVLLGNANFKLIGEVTLANEHIVDRAGLLGRLRSSSQFARLPSVRQDELIAGLEGMLEGEGERVDLTQHTKLTALRKVSRAEQ